MQSNFADACTVASGECEIRSRVAIQRGQWRYLCRMHVKSGTKQTLEAVTLSFLQGSGQSSCIPYPMSLCCWDKVVFVCPWLLARAHRALKLRLNDGIFISTPPFHARSHPSLLSFCTEPQTPPHPTHTFTFLLATAGVAQYCTDTSTGLVISLGLRRRTILWMIWFLVFL